MKDYEIVFICDDSQSMNILLMNNQQRRCDNLRELVQIAVEFGTLFDSNDIVVHFINRSNFHKTTDPD